MPISHLLCFLPFLSLQVQLSGYTAKRQIQSDISAAPKEKLVRHDGWLIGWLELTRACRVYIDVTTTSASTTMQTLSFFNTTTSHESVALLPHLQNASKCKLFCTFALWSLVAKSYLYWQLGRCCNLGQLYLGASVMHLKMHDLNEVRDLSAYIWLRCSHDNKKTQVSNQIICPPKLLLNFNISFFMIASMLSAEFWTCITHQQTKNR